VSLLDRYYDGAGRSGQRRFKNLAKDWRHRTIGRRTSVYFWTLYTLLLLPTLKWTPSGWRFGAGLLFGMVGMGFYLFRDALMPDHIKRWQRGAWGEQNTAKALKPLKKAGWLVRHDLAARYGKGNRDHIAVGPAIYLLDSKLLKDQVWLEGEVLHVRRVDDSGDSYAVTHLTSRMAKAAQALKRDVDSAVGFPVAVYPVVVIWGYFDAGVQWAGSVAYVDGDKLAEWLGTRPTDIRDDRKQQAVRDWLAALPSA
jgi:hypothetical protein